MVLYDMGLAQALITSKLNRVQMDRFKSTYDKVVLYVDLIIQVSKHNYKVELQIEPFR